MPTRDCQPGREACDTGTKQYRFGHCLVRSALSLDALPRSEGHADVTDDAGTIRVSWADAPTPPQLDWRQHWHERAEVVLSLAKDAPYYWLRVPDMADFRLEPAAGEIRVSPDARALAPETLEHLLVDQILPRMLAHRGDLLVHASAMQVGARCALFLAPSGWGKSTLAGLLGAAGHALLSDDCVLLATRDGRLTATSTYPSLRLYRDSLAAVFDAGVPTRPVAGYTSKRRADLRGPVEATAAVDALFILGSPANPQETVQTRSIRAADACIALIRHSFRLDLEDRQQHALHLEQCSHAARTVPAFSLDYPRDFAIRDALTDAITHRLASLAAHS